MIAEIGSNTVLKSAKKARKRHIQIVYFRRAADQETVRKAARRAGQTISEYVTSAALRRADDDKQGQ